MNSNFLEKTTNFLKNLILTITDLKIYWKELCAGGVMKNIKDRIFNKILKSYISHGKHFLLFVLILGFSFELFARAGGGGRYHSSSSSSSGGGGGGGIAVYFIFQIIRLLFYLTITHPIIGIPLDIIIVVAIFFFFKKSGDKTKIYYQSNVIKKARKKQTKQQQEQIINQLKTTDPNFDQQELFERLKKAFVAIQDAWSNQNLSKVQQFISDGVFERFSLQFKEQKEENYQNIIKNVSVNSVSLEQIESDKVFDTITVRFDASAIDFYKNIKTGEIIDGEPDFAEPFTEYWTFLRKKGTKSVSKGLFEGSCPNCGAPLSINQTAKCESCGSFIKSGQYDWVLTEITQASEWEAVDSTTIPGVSELEKTDKGFSVQTLEDRASVIFWRKIESLRNGNTNAIKKVSTNEFASKFEKETTKTIDNKRVFPQECAVGSVSLKGVLLEEDFDKTIVEVRWSSRLYIKDNGKTKPLGTIKIARDYFLLIRKHGVDTELKNSLTSSHCPTCSAPITDEMSDACEYCGTIFNDTSKNWILSYIGNKNDKKIFEIFSKIKNQEQENQTETLLGTEILAWMIYVMLADGKIDEKERKMLTNFAKQKNISQDFLEKMITSALNQTLQTQLPKNEEEAKEWLNLMIKMALADGTIDKNEKIMLQVFSRRIGLEKSELETMINKTREELFKQSKEFLNNNK